MAQTLLRYIALHHPLYSGEYAKVSPSRPTDKNETLERSDSSSFGRGRGF